MLGTALGLGALSTAQNLGNWGLGFVSASASDKRSYKYTKKLMRLQQAFAREMASTAHQLEVEDLRKAGLNPILSAGGSGAHAQVGGSPSVGGSSGSSPSGDIVGDAINYATAAQSISSAKTAQKLQTEQIATEKAKQKEFETQAGANMSRSILDRAQAAEVTSGLPLNRLPGYAINSLKNTGVFDWIANKLVGNPSGVSKSDSAKNRPVAKPRRKSSPSPSAKQQQQEYKQRYYNIHNRDNGSLNRPDWEWNPVSNTYERR